ncbi:MAG: nucleoside-diphosphate-sugar pyrophosphorylase [Ignavibacteria bacterium CG_4_9_14_0_2_um_filter_37_13]|nr:MAG: nucleoside-diphosphate-sugar pyrophosphorylase [Ignavibacteria bacterium CG_4_9_14_0_2_um_filter_37_13]
MNLAIIGAGESSRLKEEGLNVPKHLITINGEYLIDRIIRIGYENGFQKVYCIINTKEKELQKHLLEENFKIPVELIVKDTESSMHSLFELSPFLLNESFCLATTDSVFLEKEFSDFLKISSKEDAVGVLAVTQYIDDEKPLCVGFDEQNMILNFSDDKNGYNWVTGGLYYFSPLIFNEMQTALQNDIIRLRNFLRLLIKQNYKLKAFPFSKIIDVDHISDIEKAEDFLVNNSSYLKEKK